MVLGYFRGPRLFAPSKKAEGGLRASLLGAGEAAPEAEEAVPKGYFAVYVGAEARRFVVPTRYLRQAAFRELMERAAEEFGFGQAGGLRIPCPEEDFEATLRALDAGERRQGGRGKKKGRGRLRLL